MIGSIAKAWQIGTNALVLCISVPKNLILNGIKKIYLQLNIDESAPSLRRIDEKPDSAEPKGVFSDQIRKHLIGAQIVKVGRSENKSLLVEIQSRNGKWLLFIEAAKPPMMWLIDPESNVFAKMTRNQSYTKKYRLDSNDLPDTTSHLGVSEIFTGTSKNDPPAHDDNQATDQSLIISAAQRALLQQIRRRLRTARKSIKRLESEVRSAKDVEAAQLTALALKANFASIQPGMHFIDVNYPEENPTVMRIPLDASKSPGENLELKFRHYKKTKGACEHQRDFLMTTIQYSEDLNNVARELEEKSFDAGALAKFASKLKISEKQKMRRSDSGQAPMALPYRLVKSATGVEFRIGKGPKQNDELTKSLRGNDWWFHVVQGGGSHIVVSSRYALNGALEPSIQRQAAILALHYSKSRKACEGEVYMTQKQNLRKTKGLNPGLWLVDRSQILFVRYDASELKAIVGTDEGT
jgi:hypothetical protein